MATKNAAFTRRQIEEKIVALAWKDDNFCKRFLADPKGQFESRLKIKLPATLKMAAHQEDENNLHFVIPMKPNVNVNELSDEQLEKVAGGVTPVSVIATLIVSAAVVEVINISIADQTGHGWQP